MSPDREILLVANPSRPDISQTAVRAAKVFRAAGIGLRVLADDYEVSRPDADHGVDELVTGTADIAVVEFGPMAAVGCEMVLVLGGDGTFLRAAELAKAASIPVLGINLGRIGFLAEAEAENLEEALSRVVRRDYRIEPRMTLDVSVRVEDHVVERGWALNEASIENG